MNRNANKISINNSKEIKKKNQTVSYIYLSLDLFKIKSI